MSSINEATDRIFSVVIMTPSSPENMEELINISTEGSKHHQERSACLNFQCTKSIDMASFQKGWTDAAVEGDLVMIQEWASLELFLESAKTEFAAKNRERITPLLTGTPITKVTKSVVGFSKN